jgi:hypothetical protein
MNERELFNAGCFLPSWAEDVPEEPPISSVHTRQNKNLQTLLDELAQIKDRVQEIQAKQWNLARLIDFHNHDLAME